MLVFIFVLSRQVPGQQTNRINQFSIGLEIEAGHSFPAFDTEQNRWSASFYPTGGLTVALEKKINRKWIADAGGGLTGYALTNKGMVDRYTLDFVSPHLITGISYHFQNHRGRNHFTKISTGFQVGYRGSFTDEFETYKVTVQGKNRFYPFIRPEIGMRRDFKRKMKGSPFRMAWEAGTFFRWNLTSLGTASIEETDFAVTLRPRGDIIGMYARLLFPTGRKSLKMKEKETTRPPVIYNPRNLK